MNGICGFVSGGVATKSGSRRTAQSMCAAAPVQSAQTDIVKVAPTNKGYIVDCNVKVANKETKHTVIIGSDIIEKLCGDKDCVDPGTLTKYVFQYFVVSAAQNIHHETVS
mmetsp:Transcript_11488/g.35091  ORF Transcript_11488/g.35091 Transcript_11488/m.35091 type:complete len:110 (+) Transcript_11488:156-485(+)